MLKLAIFDIDGTLINSNAVDGDCFVRALENVFGIRDIDTRWENYQDTTDGAIFEDIFENRFGRKPSLEETARVTGRFVTLLRESHERNPALFAEISGAREMLSRLARHPRWRPAIATGTWREAALFKLDAAGLPADGIPLATSSDAHSREEIIRACIAAASRFYQVAAFERIVSIGDAVWDMRTAGSLKIPFIRIGTAGKSSFVAEYALEDFSKPERFLKYLDEALPH